MWAVWNTAHWSGFKAPTNDHYQVDFETGGIQQTHANSANHCYVVGCGKGQWFIEFYTFSLYPDLSVLMLGELQDCSAKNQTSHQMYCRRPRRKRQPSEAAEMGPVFTWRVWIKRHLKWDSTDIILYICIILVYVIEVYILYGLIRLTIWPQVCPRINTTYGKNSSWQLLQPAYLPRALQR